MKQKLYHLTEDQKHTVTGELLTVLRERGEIVFAYLFGSFVEDRPLHDIDVAVYLSDAREVPALRYALDLSGALSAAARMPVEVTVVNGAPVTFLFHVIRGELILDRDEAVRSGVVEDTVRRYLDLKPFIRRGVREAFAA